MEKLSFTDLNGFQPASPPSDAHGRPMSVPPRKGSSFAIEGVDGAGNSTLVSRLFAELRCELGDRVLLVDKTLVRVDGDNELSARLKQYNDVVYGDDVPRLARFGDAHWLFSLAAWYSLVSSCVIEPALSGGCSGRQLVRQD